MKPSSGPLYRAVDFVECGHVPLLVKAHQLLVSAGVHVLLQLSANGVIQHLFTLQWSVMPAARGTATPDYIDKGFPYARQGATELYPNFPTGERKFVFCQAPLAQCLFRIRSLPV